VLTADEASRSWPRDDGRDDGYTLRASHFVISIEIAGFKEIYEMIGFRFDIQSKFVKNATATNINISLFITEIY
jgi:hypothetical protein